MEPISWRPKNNPRSKYSSKPNNMIICKKHPKHQQSPGVCSICLSEKLSLLSKPSRNNITKKKKTINSTRVYDEEEEEESWCSSSSYSPSQCSSCASSSASSSPVYDHQLMKSRSMAAAAVITSRRRIIRERISERTDEDCHFMKEKEKEKKSKFWSKLLIRRRGPKKIEETAGLVHSRTMREMLSTAAH